MNRRHQLERALVRRLPRGAARSLGALYGFVHRPSRSYSQFGEDLVISSFFEEIGISSGIYVDVGAFHPRWLSNTHLLARRGWSGVVVDIDEDKVRLCTAMRKNCIGITAAVAPPGAPARVEIHRFDRLWSEIDTLSEDQARAQRAKTGIDYRTSNVDTMELSAILDVARTHFGAPVDLLNIDVEGVDQLLVSHLDLDRHPVTVLCFEDNARFGGDPSLVESLDASGYLHVATLGGSQIYARSGSLAGRWGDAR